MPEPVFFGWFLFDLWPLRYGEDHLDDLQELKLFSPGFQYPPLQSGFPSSPNDGWVFLRAEINKWNSHPARRMLLVGWNKRQTQRRANNYHKPPFLNPIDKSSFNHFLHQLPWHCWGVWLYTFDAKMRSMSAFALDDATKKYWWLGKSFGMNRWEISNTTGCRTCLDPHCGWKKCRFRKRQKQTPQSRKNATSRQKCSSSKKKKNAVDRKHGTVRESYSSKPLPACSWSRI